MNELMIDVSDLKDLARDLRRVDPVLQKQFLKALGRTGEIVATRARQNASFSTRIPGSIKVRRRGVRVRVQAGGDAAPEAAPLENRGKQGTFRHPLFGDRETWVSQPAHPFLTPAAEAEMVPFEQAILSAVNATFVSAGFRA